ncbi:MAG TPA: sulfatase-like hydrolase/transferase [Xanthobacteraceae bacterium]|jgi:phosphoglycerol transferase MdoB-like AlkP superfamily enzyme
MLPVASVPKIRRIGASGAVRQLVAIALTASLHLAAIVLMLWTETDFWSKAAFILTWGLLNFTWLLILRRPSLAAGLSLATISVLVLLSRFKFEALFMTASFVDLMILDEDTISFLLMIMPGLRLSVIVAALAALAFLLGAWWLDQYRIRLRTASLGCAACLAALTGLSYAVPTEIDDKWLDENYVSKFARSASVAVTDYFTRGIIESDAAVTERLKLTAGETCRPPRRAPHIVMILDESSFDMRMVPGSKLPADYGKHFRSFDGKTRRFLAEGAGGPTWFTEYNVLTGLSSRSYGRFADSVTRFAAGRVERGLPQALARCGYRTYSLYPWYGNFLGARDFQTSTGIQNFFDAKFLRTLDNEPDSFYFDAARRLIDREHDHGPMFVFVYTMANHFPWYVRYRPELTPEWRDLGNPPEVDEYVRRQHMSEVDYKQFRARLEREFKGEPFLIVRFGDHQPLFAKHLIDPKLDAAALAKRLAEYDARYFTTYYAIDALNFRPANLASAIDKLDAPYLPLAVLEAAGVPLDPTFLEQKKIFQRCAGLFYQCAGGGEARRFNRLLIDAGLIKNL